MNHINRGKAKPVTGIIGLLLLLISENVQGQDIGQGLLGCGGFVKSDLPISYSKVEVKLYNKQGSLKYQTDCAPHNGYYLIPLYDKGEYVLKVEPPAGWKFEPTSVDLRVDGSTDPCSKNEDINFVFRGFSVEGKVVSKDFNEGPEGVVVTLQKSGSNNILRTTTTVGGSYSFSSILPGDYVVTAIHPTWKLSKSTVKVHIDQDNGNIGPALVVSGYDVHGKVFSDGDPIKDVNFLLFSDKLTSENVVGCSKKEVKGYVAKGRAHLCHVTSESDGSFVFPTLPPGEYSVVPFYKGENIKFDVSPMKLTFTVKHGSVNLAENFHVRGFSVKGRVLASIGGRPIAGAKVVLNGQTSVITEQDGTFYLDEMKAGTYLLEVEMESIYFDPINVKITPNTPHLPEIMASRFLVCGEILADAAFKKQRSIFVSADTPLTTTPVPDITDSDQSSKFCVQLPPGKFTFTPKIDKLEEDKGLYFYPEKLAVEVKDAPVSGVMFFQFRAEISGIVQCQANYDGIKIELRNKGSSNTGERIVGVTKGKFLFKDVLPGNYELAVIKDSLCWQKKVQDIVVSNHDVKDITFTQQGFIITVATTHDTNIQVTPSNSSDPMMVKLLKGSNDLCIETKGLHTVVPVGCHYFGKDSFQFDTSKPEPLGLVATQHLLTGKVITDSNSSVVIKVDTIHPESGQKLPDTLGPLKKTLVADKQKEYVHGISMWSNPGSKLTMIPQAADLLFQPTQKKITMIDDCMPDAVEFIGKLGIFVSGKITPPLPDIPVTITAQDGSIEPIVVKTSASGKYKAGPLSTDTTYDVTAEKKGYVLSRVKDKSKTDFEAFKLAEINVLVVDEKGQPLPGVLLSVTGGVDYRLNSLTLADGTYVFSGLEPGKYFLKPMMKEFRFNPPSAMLEVKEGATVNFKLQGARVAFSCFGILTSLVGDAESSVTIEAIGQGKCSHYQEEGISDNDGSFRLRGLQPECQYLVRLKETPEVNQHIERLTPNSRLITVADGDVTGVHFIAMRPFRKMDITINVITSEQYYSFLKVRLYREDAPESAVFTHQISQSAFIQAPTLEMDNKSYVLILDSTMSRSNYDFDLPSISFKADVTYKHFVLKFTPRSRPLDADVSQTSLLAIPLTALFILLLANTSKLAPLFGQASSFLQDLFNSAVAARNTNNGNGNGSNGDSISSYDSLLAANKKKAKPRKT